MARLSVPGLAAFGYLALVGGVNALADDDGPAQEPAISEEALDFFESEIRPLFVSRCYDCHGPYLQEPKSGLVLATRAGWMRGGKRGEVIVPGDPDASRLIQAVRYADPALQMPPEGKLSEQEIAALVRWVEMGAPDPRTGAGPPTAPRTPIDFEEARKHWAYRPVRDVRPPAVSDEAWVRNEIDRFVLARLEDEGLAPAPEADKRTLIRRASFDLVGLPPTPEEVDAFLADDSPDAFDRVVERLLASPHYGERWARYWLDLARYADSNGLDENLALANAWRYRDYVVRAFNEDKPYDVFLTEQLAGDLMPETEDLDERFQRLTATGFLVLGPKMLAEQDKPKLLMDVVDEQMDVACQAMLGMTVGCARCHDHKFDPIPTEDYYALAGIFRSTSTMAHLEHVSRWREVELASPEDVEARKAWKAELETVQHEVDELTEAGRGEIRGELRGEIARYMLAAQAVLDDVGFVEAEDFDRGNLHVDDSNWGAPAVVILHTDKPGPQFVEYLVNVPAGRPYRLDVRYASAEERPMRLLVDGAVLADSVLGEKTGSFHPDGQTWFRAAALPAGVHRLRLERDGAVPHLDKLLIAPEDWPAPTAMDGLAPGLVRRWADWLAWTARTDDPLFRAWNRLAGVPAGAFAARAAELAPSEWSPSLIGALPPESLRELAGRYQAAIAGAPELEPFTKYGPLAVPDTELAELFPAEIRTELEARRARLAELRADAPPPPDMALAVQDGDVQDVPVHKRGSHLNLERTAVPRGFLRITDDCVAPPEIPADTSGRLQLARWMTDPAHPLTSRVMANRIWKGHFGEGLVRSPSNFGVRGDEPTHPALLDWLAREFVRGGWSVKHMHRLIMGSSAYRMASQVSPAIAERDPANRLLSHMSRRRLEAELVRDSVLLVSGRLDPTVGGSLVTTPNAGYVTNDQSGNAADYTTPRRSLYLPVIRNAMYDLFSTFDYNDPSVPIDQRPSTTVAHQALLLMNSPLLLESSAAFARSVLAEPGTDQEHLRIAYRRALARPPSGFEIARALGFLADMREAAEPGTTAAAAAEAALDVPATSAGERSEMPDPAPIADDDPELLAWRGICQVLFASNEFIYVD